MDFAQCAAPTIYYFYPEYHIVILDTVRVIYHGTLLLARMVVTQDKMAIDGC